MLVKDLFKLNKDFKDFKLLAGEKGLYNEIKSVDIMEVPDGVYWTKPGDFIITTGYSIKKEDASLEFIVKTLIERRVAALGFKVGRFVDEIPDDILNFADKHNFPIIYIPITTSYISIFKPIYNLLENKESYEFYIITEFKKELQNLMGKSYNISNVKDLLFQYIGHDVYIFWNDKSNIKGANNDFLSSNIKKGIEDNLAEIYSTNESISFEEMNYKYTIFKVEGVNTILGFVCIAMNKGEELTKVDEMIIRESIPLISIYFISYANKIMTNNKSIDDFYFNVLEGRYENNEFKLREDASYLDIDININRLIWILDFSLCNSQEYNSIEEKVLDIMDMQNKRFYYQNHNRGFIFITELRESPKDVIVLKDYFKFMLAELNKQFPNKSFNIGVSKPCGNLKYLKYAYEEADFSLIIGKKLSCDENIFFYDNYMIYHLLCEIGDHPTLVKIYRNTVKRLIDYDSEYNTELLRTVKVFVNNDFNINQSAEKLFIHRNTLYKRIDRINTILDLDIDKSENRLILQIALKYNEILEGR